MSINCNSSEDCFESTSTPQNGIDGIGTWCFTAYAQNVIDNIPTGFAFERLNSECWTAQICKHTPSEPTPEEFANHWTNVCHGLPLDITADPCPCACNDNNNNGEATGSDVWTREQLPQSSIILNNGSTISSNTQIILLYHKVNGSVTLDITVFGQSPSAFNLAFGQDFSIALPANLTASGSIGSSIMTDGLYNSSFTCEVARASGERDFISVPVVLNGESNILRIGERYFASGNASFTRNNSIGACVGFYLRGQIHYKLKL